MATETEYDKFLSDHKDKILVEFNKIKDEKNKLDPKQFMDYDLTIGAFYNKPGFIEYLEENKPDILREINKIIASNIEFMNNNLLTERFLSGAEFFSYILKKNEKTIIKYIFKKPKSLSRSKKIKFKSIKLIKRKTKSK